MALYAFACGDCGPFEVRRPMARATDPADCPTCGAAGRRVFTAPSLALVERPLGRALERAERSGHEPAVVSAPAGRPLPHRHRRSAPQPWAVSGC